MPRDLPPIPGGTQIVERDGAITVFFRLLWEVLRAGFNAVGTLALAQRLNQNAALGTTTLYTTKAAGFYRISYYLRKTAIDGVASSLTATLGWTETLALTEAFAALVVDAVTDEQSGSKVVWADSFTNLTVAVAYVSTTPGNMKYRLDTSVEQLL